MAKGFIFDMDGVVTDTVPYHYQSWKVLAGELGFDFTWDDNERLRGRSRREALELFLDGRRMSDASKRRLLERKQALFLESIQAMGPDGLLPGVAELLEEARGAGIRLGLASASRNVRTVCERLDILHLFDAVGDGASVTRPKPAPDVFIWVAGRLGLSPAQCIVFEDAEAGVEAALKGGFRVVGIGPPERVARAHTVAESLAGARVTDFDPALERRA